MYKFTPGVFLYIFEIKPHSARCVRVAGGFREIAIDTDRRPLAFAEFTLKELERDKEGNWIDEIPDGNDHSIDAVRYAAMDDVRG